MAKRINAQLVKARKQWDAEAHEMQNRADNSERARIDAAVRADALLAELDKVRKDLANHAATAARLGGECEGLKLAMRMLANTIIGKETYSSWPWQAPDPK